MTNRAIVTLVRSPDHRIDGHPESPARLELFDGGFGPPLDELVVERQAAPASLEAVRRVHTNAYLDRLSRASRSAPAILDGGDTYVTSSSYADALHAAGAAVGITRSVLRGEHLVGFSLARPPGHHASRSQALGFCLLNNIAIAVRESIAVGLDRVMVVDFDVHHGNGTQDLFWQDPNVAYVSTHQFGIFPGTGRLSEQGGGPGAGTVLNLPLMAGTGESAYLDLFRRVIPAAAEQFKPDLVLVSAGYDPHWRDPLAQLELTCNTFYEIAQTLAEVADAHSGGRVVYILEGGYDPEVLFRGVLATLSGALGLPMPPDPIGQPTSTGLQAASMPAALFDHPLLRT
jgi:acetoin utilization deacetylase AcuC-like enzyme